MSGRRTSSPQYILLLTALLHLCAAGAFANYKQIVAGEYFIDFDPGAGLGIAITGAYGDSTAAINVPAISTAGLAAGMHAIFVRFLDRDSSGTEIWGEPRGTTFNVSLPTSSALWLIAAEYFVDSDPGVGNGIPISGSYGDSTASISLDDIATPVILGTHNIFVRFRDSNGVWGNPQSMAYNVGAVETDAIFTGEYFVDTDPGAGFGIPMTGDYGNETVTVVTTNVQTNGLSFGMHSVFVRLRNALGTWGEARGAYLNIASNNGPVRITGAEYFVDQDPGIGSANTLYANDGSFDEASESVSCYGIPTSGLSVGTHQAFVRMRDNVSGWSLAQATPFLITSNSQSPSVGRLIGTVLDLNHLPLDSVSIMLSPSNRHDTTDGLGGFILDSLSPGSYGVLASRAGFVTKDTLVSVAAGSVTNIGLTLIRSVDITIDLSDEFGEPVTAANITVRDSSGAVAASSSGGAGFQIMEPQPGRFLLRLLPGRYRLLAEAALLTTRVVEFYVESGQVNIPVRMNIAQFSRPTHLFLIRGLKFLPLSPYVRSTPDSDPQLWQNFVNRFDERFSGSSLVHKHLVEINPTGSLSENRRRLAAAINQNATESTARIILIGHSMGGLIARSYVANGDRNVERIFTIDTPHAGSWAAVAGDLRANICYYIHPWLPLHCADPNHPAFQELIPTRMKNWNESIRNNEQSKQTEYVLISSSSDLSGEGDLAVNLRSQLGKYENGQDIFSSFSARVARPNTHSCSVIRCDGGVTDRFVCHLCAPQNDNIINFILNGLNTPIEQLQGAPTLSALSVSPDPITVLLQADTVHQHDTLIIPITLPGASLFQCHVFGLPIGSHWSLTAPSLELIDDSLEIYSLGGTFEQAVDSSSFSLTIPSPEAGAWILRLYAGLGDSSLVVTQVLASLPLYLEPTPPSTAISPTQSFPLSARVTSVPGVTIDSVTVEVSGDSVVYNLTSSGDSIWSVNYSAGGVGSYPVEMVAFAHAGTEQYRVQAGMDFVVENLTAALAGGVNWQAVNSDADSLYETLQALVSVQVDSAAAFRVSATLVGAAGEFIAAAFAEDTLFAGPHEITLAFDGKHLADARVNGPYVLTSVRLDWLDDGPTITLDVSDSLSLSPAYSFSEFEGRPGLVENVGAVRTGGTIECFWTPHHDPDIASYKVYYDPDGLPPYEGTGLMEGNSPVNAGNSLSLTLSGADSLMSYTFAVRAVDSAGSESDFSLPYTVFALSVPDTVDSVTIQVIGTDYELSWPAVSGGARYFVEMADSPDGVWTAIAATYSTTYRRPLEFAPKFFRVKAVR